MIKDKFKVNIDKSEFMKACSSLPTPPLTLSSQVEYCLCIGDLIIVDCILFFFSFFFWFVLLCLYVCLVFFLGGGEGRGVVERLGCSHRVFSSNPCRWWGLASTQIGSTNVITKKMPVFVLLGF